MPIRHNNWKRKLQVHFLYKKQRSVLAKHVWIKY